MEALSSDKSNLETAKDFSFDLWMLGFSNGRRNRLVFERKQTIKVAEPYRGLPAEFITYMNYIRGLDDQDKPDYKYLRGLFGRLFRRKGFEHNKVFAWTMREFERRSNMNQQRPVPCPSVREQKTERALVGRCDRKRRRRRRADTKES